MRVSGLDSDGDWRFGKGKANYLRRSEAIQQNVVTRLRSFTDDWFLNITNGLPWIDMLGSRNNETRILREIERVVLSTEGVRSIERIELISIDENRNAVIHVSLTDIYGVQITEVIYVVPPPSYTSTIPSAALAITPNTPAFVLTEEVPDAWWSYDGATLPNYGSEVRCSYHDSSQNTTWICTESWHGLGRDEIVEGYRHTTGLTSPRGVAFESSLTDDDHGISSIVVDDDGYLHVIGGAHIGTFKYSISAATNDATEWNSQSHSFSTGTYPKLLKKTDGTLVFYYRKDLDTLVFYQTTAVGGGSATWGSEVELWDRAGAGRVYPTAGFLDGDDLWVVAMKANAGNTLRWDLYILVYDTVSGELRNHNGGTVISSGSLPINDTTADASFKVDDWNDSLLGWYPDMLHASDDSVHCVWSHENAGGTYDIYHMYKATPETSNFSTPEIIATTVYSNNAPQLVEYASSMRCWFVEDVNNDFGGYGGNLYFAERLGTTWTGAVVFHQPDTARYGFHRPHRVPNGQNDLKLLISERTSGSLDSSAGGLKTHILDSSHTFYIRTKESSATYTALVSALAGTYDNNRLIAIDHLINNLNGYGILSLLDGLWVFNAPLEADALINWVDPGTYDATYSGSPSFTVDQGIATDGSTNYIDLNFNPSTAGGNYAQNDASFGMWCLTANSGAGAGGALSGGNGVFINPWSGSFMSGRINHSSSANNMSDAGVGDAVGLSAIDRDASNSSTLYRDGGVIDTSSYASESLVNANIILGGTSGAGRAQEFAMAWIGGGLTAKQHAAMRLIFATYFIGIDKGSI